MKLTGIELVSMADVKKIMLLDHASLSTNRERFIDNNCVSYYLVINTWLLMIKQYSKYGWLPVLNTIKAKGLISVIISAQAYSDALIQGVDQMIDPANPFREVVFDCYRHLEVTELANRQVEKEIGKRSFATALQLLRYPKRLSLRDSDKLVELTLAKLLQLENRTKVRTDNNRGFSYYHAHRLKEVISEAFDWDSIIKAIKAVISDNYDFIIPTGSTADVGKSPARKLLKVSSQHPDWFFEPFGLKYSGMYIKEVEQSIPNASVTCVPKTYKVARVIAPECVSRQAKAKAIERAIARYLPSNIPLHDQTVNQEWAKMGSITGLIATVDQTSASDTISKELFRYVFPTEFVNLIDPYLSVTFTFKKKGKLQYRLMQMMSTAGNALTFILESMFFYSVDLYATSMVDLFTDDQSAFPLFGTAEHPLPSVYGDDQIVHTEVFDTLVDISESLGLIVNVSKSFSKGKYRESCGEEYADGLNVSSVYFPRRVLNISYEKGKAKVSHTGTFDVERNEAADTISLLISLQHRLYYPCYEASRFVYEFVRHLIPGMTVSLPEEGDDLWGYVNLCKFTKPPYACQMTWDSTNAIHRSIMESHMQPSITYDKVNNVDEHMVRLFNVWKYNNFLKYGPRYDDPLMELLKVSSPPPTIEQAFSQPLVKWRLKR